MNDLQKTRLSHRSSPVSKLLGEEGRGEAKSSDREKAWFSINPSILSEYYER
jgi:hypothetical protein